MGFGIGGLTKAVGSLFGGSSESSKSSGGMDPWTVGAQFGADTLTGYINNYYGKKAVKQQFQYNKALIDYQNEYNSPKNQMARLEEAGLNPNLVYGNGSAIIGSGSGSVSAHPGSQPSTNILAAYNLDAQNRLIDAQVKEVNARTGLINTQNANWTHDHENMSRLLLELGKRIADKFGSKGVADYNMNGGKPVITYVNGRPVKVNYDRNGRVDLGA